jgi:hypothetical protein
MNSIINWTHSFDCWGRVLAATAEAEREGNAKVITAEAEYKAASTYVHQFHQRFDWCNRKRRGLTMFFLFSFPIKVLQKLHKLWLRIPLHCNFDISKL